jgi:hypothetical protein
LTCGYDARRLAIPQLAFPPSCSTAFINRITRKNRIGEKTMKKMKAFCTATVLALTLSVSAFAGDIASPGAAYPGGIGTSGSVSTAAPTLSTNETAVVSNSDGGVMGDMLLALLSMF